MSLQTMRQASRKEVTSPLSGETYLIRKLAFGELTEANLNAILDSIKENGEEPKLEGLRAVALSNKMELESRRHVLTKSVLAPRIFFGDEDKTPDGEAHILWLGQDAIWLSEAIMQFSELDKESVERIEVLIKNALSSKSPTPSVTDMGDSPMSSSN